MKFSDLDKQLDEAPDLSKIKGKLQRAGTKLAKHTPFSKETRLKAKKKGDLQQTALGIKDEFHEWQAETGSEQTAKEFLNFLGQKYPEYVQAAKEMAVKLKQMKPESTPDAEKGDEELSVARPSDSEDPDATGDKSKKIDAPEKEADLELEPEEEVEEEVDMSASIYESRLAYFLIEDAKLKDNQLDTLIFRTLQAVKKAGGKVGSSQPSDEISKTADKVSKAKASDDEELSVAEPRKREHGKAQDVSKDEVVNRWSDKVEDYVDELSDILPDDKDLRKKFDNLNYQYWGF